MEKSLISSEQVIFEKKSTEQNVPIKKKCL